MATTTPQADKYGPDRARHAAAHGPGHAHGPGRAGATVDLHDHAHGEPSAHDHVHQENYAAHPHAGHVMMDIGDDVGALIVHTDESMHGVEVEISPAGHDSTRRSHKDVLERILGPRCFAAVFDHITEGEYTLWTDGVARQRNVTVHGGEIAQCDWRAAAGGTPPAGAGS